MVAMPSWIQDPRTGKLIPKDKYQRDGPQLTIMGDIEPFVSPVDGTLITSRSHLREHNKRHGVTNTRDYGDNYFQRKAEERSAEISGTSKKSRESRIEDIQRAITKHGG